MRYLSLSLATFLTLACSFATAQSSNHEVTPEQYVTQEELAAIYVLSEICPSLTTHQQDFQHGYQALLQEYLPHIANPSEALHRLMTQPNSAPILKEAQQDADRAGEAKNAQICQELTTYRK